MVQAADITDAESLRDWLEGRSKEEAVWISMRASARVLPIWWDYTLGNLKAAATGLEVLRILVIADARIMNSYSDEGLAFAAFSAEDDAGSAKTKSAAASINSAKSTASSVYSVDLPSVCAAAAAAVRAAAAAAAATELEDARAAQWRHVQQDVLALLNEGMGLRPLRASDRNPLEVLWKDIQLRIPQGEDVPDYHSFWLPWYDDLREGRASRFPPELLNAVALIPHDDPDEWAKGDLHINNTVIPGLMREYASSAAKTVVEISREEATGDFVETAVTSLTHDLFQDAKDRVAEAIQDFRDLMDKPQTYYRAFEDDIDRLDTHMFRTADRPVRMYEKLADAMQAILDCAQANGITNDAQVVIFLRELERSRRDIRADDEKIEAREAKRLRVGYDELLRTDQESFRALISAGAAESEPGLKAEMQEDVGSIEDRQTPKETRDRAVLRSTERVLQMDDIKRQEGAGGLSIDTVVAGAEKVTKIAKAGEATYSIIDKIVGWMF